MGVKIYGTWASPFSMRVEIALQIKGIEYEFVEEDLLHKSDELAKYNPIHKKVPVLIHDGKVMVESLVILEYIDETWKANPILPTDAYQKAQARFWAKFVDDKVTPLVRSALMSEGEESEKAIPQLDEVLQILESEIKGKQFFGGKSIGYLDIVASMVPFWITCLQEVVGKEVITKEKFPSISSWADELLGCSVMKQNVPHHDRLKEFYQARFALMNAKTTN
ncbi:hypothetical protein BVRB_3g069410 [Beta vulgaris subsp. vulgaris]|nr:hypothetical protein BVRB_3g069410 [Beta vulgaris subsp. vulgaris]